MKIKQKVLKELEKILGHKCFDTLDCGFAVDFTLAEVGKVIDGFDTEPHGYSKCINMDKMKEKLKEELGIK